MSKVKYPSRKRIHMEIDEILDKSGLFLEANVNDYDTEVELKTLGSERSVLKYMPIAISVAAVGAFVFLIKNYNLQKYNNNKIEPLTSIQNNDISVNEGESETDIETIVFDPTSELDEFCESLNPETYDKRIIKNVDENYEYSVYISELTFGDGKELNLCVPIDIYKHIGKEKVKVPKSVERDICTIIKANYEEYLNANKVNDDDKKIVVQAGLKIENTNDVNSDILKVSFMFGTERENSFYIFQEKFLIKM